MIRTEAWTQNAMLYKDVTQWMRRRTFLTFFFGLLGIAEVTALLVAMSDTEQGGLIIFGILTGVTLLYLIGLAGMAFRLFADELGNRTFELFEMAGHVAGTHDPGQARLIHGLFRVWLLRRGALRVLRLPPGRARLLPRPSHGHLSVSPGAAHVPVGAGAGLGPAPPQDQMARLCRHGDHACRRQLVACCTS